jgi:Fe-S oxidoreductase
MKAEFLHRHYATVPRPRRDHLVRWMEPLTLAARHMPRVANAMLSVAPTRQFGFCNLPKFATLPVERALQQAGANIIQIDRPKLTAPPEKSAILVIDSFLGLFDTGPLIAAARILKRMGFSVHATPPVAMGKALQVRGFLDAYGQVCDRTLPHLKALAKTGAPLVVIEPAVLMALRQEWPLVKHCIEILSLEEFLSIHHDKLPHAENRSAMALMPHCTQASGDPGHTALWQGVFATCNLDLITETVGCCGMAGMFGHETEHRELSQEIFDLSWREPLQNISRTPVASGFSCRCQSARFTGRRPEHPIEALDRAFNIGRNE